MKLKVNNLKCEDGQNLQGAIEHFANILLNKNLRKFGERTMSDFDIEYNGKLLLSLIKIREHMEIVEEKVRA